MASAARCGIVLHRFLKVHEQTPTPDDGLLQLAGTPRAASPRSTIVATATVTTTSRAAVPALANLHALGTPDGRCGANNGSTEEHHAWGGSELTLRLVLQ